MKASTPLALTAALAFLVAAVGTPASADGSKQTMGTLLGGVLGGVAGSRIGKGNGRTAGIIVGALGGAMIGGQIGSAMDENDRRIAENTAQHSLEYSRSGYSSSWTNPDNGHTGTFTPTATYQTAVGENCREYETTIYVDGRQEMSRGVACRQPDGSWEVRS